ncbi:hypothetical protein [Streptomyces sp. Je 1-332]|uniref:hypothetical protein n=1 Tax=Streptomyces sp. Je 1-332 TaxID=3231270 RepID=UPI003459CC96
MAWRVVRWAPALALGALWWWGVLRLALVPEAGALEGAVAAGGWGLSLLPVHCVPQSRAVGAARAKARAARAAARRQDGGRLDSGGLGGGWWRDGRVGGAVARGVVGGVTKAWRRRSGGGSGLS